MGQLQSTTRDDARDAITAHVFIHLDSLADDERGAARRLEVLRAALPGAVPHIATSRAMRARLQRAMPDAPFLARVHATASPERALLGRYLDALAADARVGAMAAIVVAQPGGGGGGDDHLPRAFRYHTPDARLAAGRLMFARVTEAGDGVVVEGASRFPLAFERRADMDAFVAALRSGRLRSSPHPHPHPHPPPHPRAPAPRST